IRIVSHSSLFYWWPVWAVGFLMAAITGFSDYRMAIVPEYSKVAQKVIVPGIDGERDVLALPKGHKWPTDAKGDPVAPHLHVSRSKNLGVLFSMVMLLVVAITNIPLRGLWS